ncbi:hypothetical protein MKW98_010550 [Papaver atlanticum]|uniref:Uncharacterized protein n=1 Tax=Papaver atlanticum TaxID=357466 RepID=A0AAD4S2D7_9MAGN|nr:hypothetical protein MKW98_010550 [Papaver atlanticum]
MGSLVWSLSKNEDFLLLGHSNGLHTGIQLLHVSLMKTNINSGEKRDVSKILVRSLVVNIGSVFFISIIIGEFSFFQEHISMLMLILPGSYLQFLRVRFSLHYPWPNYEFCIPEKCAQAFPNPVIGVVICYLHYSLHDLYGCYRFLSQSYQPMRWLFKLEDGVRWIHVCHVMVFFLVADIYFKLLKFKKGYRLLGISIVLVLVIGSESVTQQLLEVLSGVVVGVCTQLEVAVLRCAFTMVKVIINYALVGILTWVDARQCKLVHSQLLGLLIRKRGVERKWYTLLSHMCVEAVGEYWIMSDFVRNFLFGFLHMVKYGNPKLEPSADAAKQPSCGTILEGEAVSN